MSAEDPPEDALPPDWRIEDFPVLLQLRVDFCDRAQMVCALEVAARALVAAGFKVCPDARGKRDDGDRIIVELDMEGLWTSIGDTP